MSTGFCMVGFSLVEISLTDFGTTVRLSWAHSSNAPSSLDLCAHPQCFLFTIQSWVTPSPCFWTINKCASLEFPSPYHFSRPDSLHEIAPTIACHFHRGVKLRIPFVIVAFSGTRVGTGFLSGEGEQASKESLALLSGHGVEGRRLPSPRSFPSLFGPLQKR